MKKTLLFFAAVAMAAPAWAEVLTTDTFDPDVHRVPNPINLVVNGSFNDPDFEFCVNYVTVKDAAGDSIGTEARYGNPYGWGDYHSVVSEGGTLPGWTYSTGGLWNGVIELLSHDEPDDWWVEPGNTYCVRALHYYDNGWTTLDLVGEAKGLEIGKTYTLDLMVWYNFPDNQPGNPKFSIKVTDDEGLGEGYPSEDITPEVYVDEIKGDKTYTWYWGAQGGWNFYKTTFTARHETVQVHLKSGVWNYEGVTSHNNWVNWDEVRIYDPATQGQGDSVASVAVDAEQATEIYTLQGVRVPSTANLHGVYIVKQGNKATKVVY